MDNHANVADPKAVSGLPSAACSSFPYIHDHRAYDAYVPAPSYADLSVRPAATRIRSRRHLRYFSPPPCDGNGVKRNVCSVEARVDIALEVDIAEVDVQEVAYVQIGARARPCQKFG